MWKMYFVFCTYNYLWFKSGQLLDLWLDQQFLSYVLLTIVSFFPLPCTENIYADHQATSGQSQPV